MNKKRIVMAVLLFMLSSVSVSLTLAWAQESEACQEPKVAYLAEQTGATCQEILDLQASGVGWGQISRAYSMAEQFGDLGLDGEELLALREADMGWGQISHAQYLASADLGISFDEAIAMMQNGMGWGEIRTELGLEEGPPPWARQGGNQENGPGSNNGNGQGNGNGPGNGNGNGNNGNGNKGTNGPPPWAGQGNGDD